MNPVIFWRIIAGIASLIGVGGAAYGYDQHDKRKKEQARSRQAITRLKVKIGRKEAQFAKLRPRLGSKNAQIRALADEIGGLQAQLAKKERARASA